jgi:hypothetical protein
MSANLFIQNVHIMIICILKNSIMIKGTENFLCMSSSLLGSVFVIEFQTTANFDLTIAIYSIRRLSGVDKDNVIVQINPNNFTVCENRVLNQYVLQILDTITSQYMRITKPVLIFQYSRFPGKENNNNTCN